MITRENYEEFFLLYVDDELTPAERMAVERFASAHPDLQEELEALLQCRVQPESEAVFPDKNSLLQYEESLLLYVDGELDEAGRQGVEELVRRDPEKERELLALSMTVSHADLSIVFPDKESLYHKRRRVVLMPWLQVGAAAAVLAVVVMLAMPRKRSSAIAVSTPAAKNTAPAVTRNDTAAFHTIKAPAETAQPIGTDHSSKAVYAASSRKTPKNTSQPATLVDNDNRPVTPANTDNRTTTLAASDGRPAALLNTNNSHATLASTDSRPSTPANTNGKPATLAAIGQGHANNETNPDKVTVPVTTVAAVNIPRDESSFATQALLREQENGNTDLADNMPPTAGKTKLRGLFRRVTRAFGKTADRDDDGQRQVLISAFQVALK